MKVLITNTVLLNSGDAAIAKGLIKTVKAAFGNDTSITVYDSQPIISGRCYPDLSLRRFLYLVRDGWYGLPRIGAWLRRLRGHRLRWAARFLAGGRPRLSRWLVSADDHRDVRAYAEADLIVSTGGTYLVENYGLISRFYDFEFARISRTPYVLFTQSLGPFRKPENRAAVKSMCDHAALVMLRDERSRNNLLELGVAPAKLTLSADAAFVLADPATLRAAREPTAVDRSKWRVAISVRDWAYFQDRSAGAGMKNLKLAIGALTEHLIRHRGAEVVFISSCQGVSEYWTDDSRTAEAIAEALPAEIRDRVQVDRSFRGPEDLLAELARFDVVVAMRMHIGILSLCAGTPVFPIAYEFKTTELFRRLGAGEWVEDVNTLDAATLPGHFDAFLEALPALRGRLFDKVLEESATAMAAAELLGRAAAGNGSTGGSPATRALEGI